MPYLVRHAHAGDKRAWEGPDSLRPLSGSGRREAHGLLTQLRDYPITRIVSSPAVRCLQTVEPLAQRRGLQVEPADALGVDADPAALAGLLLDAAAGEAVLCSHGELIGAVLTRLIGPDLADAAQLTWPKGSTRVLEVDAGQVSWAYYLRRCDSRTPRPATTRPRGATLAAPHQHQTLATRRGARPSSSVKNWIRPERWRTTLG